MTPEHDALQTARALAPLIAAHADRIDAERRLPAALSEALHEAGMFRLLLPRSLGGGEVDPMTFVQVMEEIAKVDASTAWVIGQTAGCSMVAAYLAPAVAKDVFGGPRGVLAWGSGPQGRAVRVAGGYRLTGSWSFASGLHEATWIGAHTFVVNADDSPARHPDGASVVRTLLFPRAQATISDAWHVMGLRGTGSDTYEVRDLFVPEAYSAARDDAAERRERGPLYCFSSGNLYASGFACVSLGIARALLDAYIELAASKTAHRAKKALRDNAVVQTNVGLADARLRAARSHLLDTLADVHASAAKTADVTLEQRVRIRQAASYASREGREVGTLIYHGVGAQAIFTSGPWERRLRDLHSVSQQVQGRDDHFEAVGRFLLGLPPDSPFI
ncbi:MAG TPA: acyl-CoA dehydrogenase family protein [Methylomirabilota bacterium]|nr:acyl-CoA dehydrogenase family protein [Methylomirabilota bacterium]